MTRPLVVLDIVGLTPSMIGQHTPHLASLAGRGFACPLGTVLPAVTCSTQSTLLTGLLPRDHGVVANDWYERELAEIFFWRQSNRLVGGERVYQAAGRLDTEYTTAKLFWWYNMYAPVDWSVTPRPSYPADGRKVMDSFSQPADLKDRLQAELGTFPLMRFWGPGANIASTRWIADATIRILQWHRPSLTLAYLPHLDYNLQRLGPNDPAIDGDLAEVDAEAGRVIDAAADSGADVVVLSEYGITGVDRPVALNRVLREAGLLSVRREPLGWETLDAGGSRAFAVADHQVAHVYVHDPGDVPRVRSILEAIDGVDRVLGRDEQVAAGLDHHRSGELVVVASAGAWFTYYFWLDDKLAPDSARTVDIHRKPGYDPVEWLVDPELRWPALRVAGRLLKKKLGLRYYMDVIGLDASIVRGSHGRLPTPGREAEEGPVLIGSSTAVARDAVEMTEVKQLLLDLQFGSSGS
ncbi:MAG: alkaline phosphatase family protein [Planctomycetota bacterium]|nr:alkaline phosphatase family protein [Planctomycetota bacterium]